MTDPDPDSGSDCCLGKVRVRKEGVPLPPASGK